MHLTKADSPWVVRPSFRVKAYDSAGQVSAAREDRLANAGDTVRDDDAGQAATSTESMDRMSSIIQNDSLFQKQYDFVREFCAYRSFRLCLSVVVEMKGIKYENY